MEVTKLFVFRALSLFILSETCFNCASFKSFYLKSKGTRFLKLNAIAADSEWIDKISQRSKVSVDNFADGYNSHHLAPFSK